MRPRRPRRSHIVVAAGDGWRLMWPIDAWARLTDDDREGVISRQVALMPAPEIRPTCDRTA